MNPKEHVMYDEEVKAAYPDSSSVVMKQVASLEASVDALGSDVTRLLGRLAPMLRPEQETSDRDSSLAQVESPVCEHAAHLRRIERSVETLRRALLATADRLEL